MGPKLKALLDTAKQVVGKVWDSCKFYIIGALSLVLFFEFRDLIIGLLVKSGNRVMDSTQKKDAELAKQEDTAKSQAAAIEQQIQQEAAAPKPQVDNDWYKNKP